MWTGLINLVFLIIILFIMWWKESNKVAELMDEVDNLKELTKTYTCNAYGCDKQPDIIIETGQKVYGNNEPFIFAFCDEHFEREIKGSCKTLWKRK